MKKLQNNFTTPEQSKRLLELGVPADSADFVFMRGYSRYGKDEFVVPFYKTDSIVSIFKDREWEEGIDFIPCWSVGRLIEIMALCYKFDFPNNGSVQVYATDIKKGTTVDVLISDIKRFINKIDFSKLEDEK